MRIVVLGAGGIGGSLGARLHQGGHDVALIARGAHGEAIRGHGLTFATPEERVTLRIPVYADPGEVTWTPDREARTNIGRIKVFGWDVSSAEHPERFLVVCLAVFVAAALMVANLRRSTSGRRLIAVRNNDGCSVHIASKARTRLARPLE